MKNGKLEFRTADEAEAVFYEAFSRCDADVMQRLWADGEVICVHPGSAAIIGYEAVARSWTHILSQASMPGFAFQRISTRNSSDLAVHLVAEQVASGEGSAIVLATNVYQRFDGGWLMVEHHGSLVQQQPAQTLQ